MVAAPTRVVLHPVGVIQTIATVETTRVIFLDTEKKGEDHTGRHVIVRPLMGADQYHQFVPAMMIWVAVEDVADELYLAVDHGRRHRSMPVVAEGRALMRQSPWGHVDRQILEER